jgi:hypothetical protein
MNRPIPRVTQACEDLAALRRVIVHLSERCCLDLADRSAIGRILDGDFSDSQLPDPAHQTAQELRAMLTLLFRLESSSSEDIGIAGLHTLWRQHSEILERFRLWEPGRDALQREFAVS